jgi:Flp pilus assembly protein TadG
MGLHRDRVRRGKSDADHQSRQNHCDRLRVNRSYDGGDSSRFNLSLPMAIQQGCEATRTQRDLFGSGADSIYCDHAEHKLKSEMKRSLNYRRDERGQTLLLVVVAMSVLLGMAALAIDIATLYTASNETRRTAEAAALAGAQAIANSGITSGYAIPQGSVCNQNVTPPGTALAEERALQVVANNSVAGGAATLQATVCNFGNPGNPQFTVTVQRTGLPTFFGRIWGSFPGSVTATAKAEAYNPSGTAGAPIQIGSVKPWGVPNCDPSHSSPGGLNCGAGLGSLVDTTTGAVSNSVVGTVFDLTEVKDLPVGSWATAGTPGNIDFLAVDIPITASNASCPASGTLSCSASLQPAAPSFPEMIACANSIPVSCGQTLNVNPSSGTATPSGHVSSEQAALCLIHASNRGRNMGQDQFCNNAPNPNCAPGSPISIDGGSNNPDPGLQGQNSISRSDSVVTVPVFTPCGTNCTNVTVSVVGFLQLGVARVRQAGPLRAIVMNVVGCKGTSGTNPVSGGGVSPIPVRLVQ